MKEKTQCALWIIWFTFLSTSDFLYAFLGDSIFEFVLGTSIGIVMMCSLWLSVKEYLEI